MASTVLPGNVYAGGDEVTVFQGVLNSFYQVSFFYIESSTFALPKFTIGVQLDRSLRDSTACDYWLCFRK